jgi:rhodanese-related sulfurtransferase
MKTAHDLVVHAKALTRELSVEQAEVVMRDADVLIDVREADEFAAGHIPGAIHASRGMLEFKLSASPELSRRDLKVVLYCKTSGRAALAAASMKEMGYLNVTSLAGGFDAWVAAGKPVAKPQSPSFE